MHALRDLLNQFATHAGTFLNTTLKDISNWALQPLLWNTDAIAILVANPANEDGIWLLLGIGRGVTCDWVEGTPASVGLWGLLLEQLVDGFHLVEVSTQRGMKLGQ